MPDDPGKENNVLNAHPDEAKRLHEALRNSITWTDVEAELKVVYQSPLGDWYYL